MSRPASHIRSHRTRSPWGAAKFLVAVSVAVGSLALATAGTAAADPAPGPGSPEWTRHLELEYGDRAARGPVVHGPGSPEWTRHLELEYGR